MLSLQKLSFVVTYSQLLYQCIAIHFIGIHRFIHIYFFIIERDPILDIWQTYYVPGSKCQCIF